MDYDVIYNGTVIGNVQGADDADALDTARSLYLGGVHGQVTVERVVRSRTATHDEAMAAFERVKSKAGFTEIMKRLADK